MKPGSREYKTLHAWIYRNYGKACYCEFCNDKCAKRYEWALIHGKEYERERENYMQLCASCHRLYDMNEERRHNARVAALGSRRSWPVIGTKGGIMLVFSSDLEAMKAGFYPSKAMQRGQKSKGFNWEYL